ncbi:mycofactocin-coupled SDR family oxidoreductase [Rhodococcus sp. IEGM 1366]|uniref:mycofactocin-coupled SDR family oxidoreductase n=1 Tax=Rhodococcus sp. IEGM 1366 TaxID=3082223 RepID=UPI0029551F07|nr:mycofactocin-coupled SDR family oxidoreductase [Rhodococcus sp. IEGM 1366]MDV8070988.1 mycofactocin-coupled SDR family oxidoreductase [Rhodococcus sp. IEGM 1366]
MSGRVEGKVAFITGAARGQGRQHAIRLAEEGADIVAVDLCDDIKSVEYSLGSADDLRQTAELVEKLDRRIVIVEADVRDRGQLAAAYEAGIESFGRLDVVVANAGVAPIGGHLSAQAFFDAVSVNLTGVINAFELAYPHLRSGASLIATGSTASLREGAVDAPHNGSGGSGYRFSKQEVARFVDVLAKSLAPYQIRVNGVHPTNVNTNMLHSRPMYNALRPDLDHVSKEDAVASMETMHPWPGLSAIEATDVAEAVLFLASDESRYVTGLQLKVDGGGLAGNMMA